MNRYDQFQVNKRRQEKEALVASGQSPEQADVTLAARDRRDQAAAWLHYELFREEYNELVASTADLMERRRGLNPMDALYQARVASKREDLGVPQLDKTRVARGNDSMKLCRRLVDGVIARL